MENPYQKVQRSLGHSKPQLQKAKHWDEGRTDALAGKPCASANGAYLEGWYSVQPSERPTQKDREQVLYEREQQHLMGNDDVDD